MGIIILPGSSLILLFMSSLKHNVGQVVGCVCRTGLYFLIECFIHCVFRQHSLGTESKDVVGAGNEQS